MHFSTKLLSMRIEAKPHSEIISCGPMQIDVKCCQHIILPRESGDREAIKLRER